MLTAFLASKKTALRAATNAVGGALSVDPDAGVVRGVAVMSVGPAQGHGFSVDMVTLQQVCDLGNAASGGVKCHLAHPEQQADGSLEDQVGAIVGRIQNFRIDGTVLRGDLFLGAYASTLPGAGDVRSYILGLAMEDPGAVGLSAVFGYELETVLDDDGMPLAEGGLVCRIDRLVQIDLVGNPAANRNGLLAAVDSPAAPASTNPLKSAMALVMARVRTAIENIRTCCDVWSAQSEAIDGGAALIEIFTATTTSAQASIVAFRACVDALNQIRSGSVSDDATSATARTISQTMSLLDDEIFAVLQITYGLALGSAELAAAAEILSRVLRTLSATADDLGIAVLAADYPLSSYMRKKNAEGDALLGTTYSPAVRALTKQCLLSPEPEKFFGRLERKAPDLAAKIRTKTPALRGAADPDPETPALAAIPAHDSLRFGGEPGVKLLTWLSSRGLSARYLGECRFEVFGTPDAVSAITYAEECVLREWNWSLADPLARIEAQRLAGLAAGAQDVAERERLAFASLAWHHESPGALAMFTMPDSTVGPHTAQTTRPSPDHAALPPVPDGMAVLVI